MQMVQIQLEIPEELNRFLEIKKVLLKLKDKRQVILDIIRNDLDTYDGGSIKEELGIK